MAAGCAADGSLQTAAINTNKAETRTAAVDPVCVSLASQIDSLRQEAAVTGLEKAATGKGASVKVKRDALARQAELNRVNAEFQVKCGPKIPASQTAQAAPAPATATTAPAAGAAQVAPVATAAAKAAPEAAQKK
jgi:hypothetical protein